MTNDNNNNNGLCTSTWGSPGSFFLHCVAAGYPVDPDEYDYIRGNTRGYTRRTYSSFFKNTEHVLPCRFCRESYLAFVAEIPIEKYIHSRQKLFELLFIVHDKVNEKIGDKQGASLPNIVNKYEKFQATFHDRKLLGCTELAKKNTESEKKVRMASRKEKLVEKTEEASYLKKKLERKRTFCDEHHVTKNWLLMQSYQA